MKVRADAPPAVNPHKLPPPRDPTTAQAIQRLAASPAVSADWLPASQFPELDELREEHHRYLRQLIEAQDTPTEPPLIETGAA